LDNCSAGSVREEKDVVLTAVALITGWNGSDGLEASAKFAEIIPEIGSMPE
jgi:hypothetical protein